MPIRNKHSSYHNYILAHPPGFACFFFFMWKKCIIRPNFNLKLRKNYREIFISTLWLTIQLSLSVSFNHFNDRIVSFFRSVWRIILRLLKTVVSFFPILTWKCEQKKCWILWFFVIIHNKCASGIIWLLSFHHSTSLHFTEWTAAKRKEWFSLFQASENSFQR